MRLATLLGPDLKATLETEPETLRETLAEFHPEDIAEILDDLDLQDAANLLRIVPDELGAQVLDRLGPDRQRLVLDLLGTSDSAPLVMQMAPDDRVDLIQELPENVASELLREIEEVEPEAAEEVRDLRAWSPETAGGLMTPDYVRLSPETKVWQAVEAVRRLSQEGQAETIYYIYVEAFGEKLVGVVSLRDLILADPGQALSDIMTEHVVRVAPEDDQERVAAAIAKYDLSAIPVVDEQGVMLGVVTVDDVVDVVIEEATEDAQKMGGVVPLEDSYFATGLREFVWKRALWLVILFFGQLLTATVMEKHEMTVASITGLVIFVPLIIATGGNSGAQSSTLIIRALAVGEMRPSDWLRVLWREASVGIAIGALLGVVGFARAWFVDDQGAAQLALAVATSIVAVVVLGTMTGSLLPLGIRRLGFDPAVSSTPFIASVVDVLGLLVYFAIAQFVFGLAG